MNPIRRQGLICLSSWLFAVLYALSLPSVLPTMFAMLAGIEGSHGIEVCPGAEETDIILTHQHALRDADGRAHRHTLLAKALTALAQRSSTPDADHRVKFAVGATSTLEKKPGAISENGDNEEEARLQAEVVVGTIAFADIGMCVFPGTIAPRPPDILIELTGIRLII